MKNKKLKIAALLAIAVVGLVALNKVKNKAKTVKSEVKNELPLATPEKPLTFTVPGSSKDITIRYSFDGKKYLKYQEGPNIRVVPEEIQKEEFESAYNSFLL